MLVKEQKPVLQHCSGWYDPPAGAGRGCPGITEPGAAVKSNKSLSEPPIHAGSHKSVAAHHKSDSEFSLFL